MSSVPFFLFSLLEISSLIKDIMISCLTELFNGTRLSLRILAKSMDQSSTSRTYNNQLNWIVNMSIELLNIKAKQLQLFILQIRSSNDHKKFKIALYSMLARPIDRHFCMPWKIETTVRYIKNVKFSLTGRSSLFLVSKYKDKSDCSVKLGFSHYYFYYFFLFILTVIL